MSFRIVPADANPTSFSHAHISSAPSAPGIHDTLRHGLGPSPLDPPSALTSAHPLEARLKNWEATQETFRMQSLRRTFGMAEPVRRGMELKMVRNADWRPLALEPRRPCIHEDILTGRDDTITWEDVFIGQESRGIVGMHDEMEKKLKMR